MALSNLIWWPWFGVPTGEIPPTPPEQPWRKGGDRRIRHEVVRRHPPSEDDLELLLSVIASES